MSIDVPSLIGAVTREVRDVERQGRKARIVVASRTFDTTLEDLWDAISNAERLPRWFAPVTGDFRLGGKYQIQGNASGTITRCEPPRELALTWEFGGGVSWVEVSLKPEGEGARLELRHIQYPEAHWDTFGPGAVGVGWELGLMGLDIHLANPNASKPPEADPEWFKTSEAKAFMRGAAEGWRDAAIASGDDETWSRDSAERTRKFYSGEQ
jgi:uncharacterized protein YndB with AHSA1/START domain